MNKLNNLNLVEKIILLNIIVFIIPQLNDFLSLRLNDNSFYEYITYQFTHGNFMHILFNMIALYTIGTPVKSIMSDNKFLSLYLIGGIFAALTHLLMCVSNGVLVGASGSIMALLAMFTFTYPNEKVYILFIPIAFKAKWIVLIYMSIELYLSIFNNGDSVSHWGHIGGFLFGTIFFLYFKYKDLIKV